VEKILLSAFNGSSTNPTVAALSAAARIAYNTWKTIAQEAAMAESDSALIAREVVAREIAIRLLQRARIIRTWEEVRTPLYERAHWAN